MLEQFDEIRVVFYIINDESCINRNNSLWCIYIYRVRVTSRLIILFIEGHLMRLTQQPEC